MIRPSALVVEIPALCNIRLPNLGGKEFEFGQVNARRIKGKFIQIQRH